MREKGINRYFFACWVFVFLIILIGIVYFFIAPEAGDLNELNLDGVRTVWFKGMFWGVAFVVVLAVVFILIEKILIRRKVKRLKREYSAR